MAKEAYEVPANYTRREFQGLELKIWKIATGLLYDAPDLEVLGALQACSHGGGMDGKCYPWATPCQFLPPWEFLHLSFCCIIDVAKEMSP